MENQPSRKDAATQYNIKYPCGANYTVGRLRKMLNMKRTDNKCFKCGDPSHSAISCEIVKSDSTNVHECSKGVLLMHSAEECPIAEQQDTEAPATGQAID